MLVAQNELDLQFRIKRHEIRDQRPSLMVPNDIGAFTRKRPRGVDCRCATTDPPR